MAPKQPHPRNEIGEASSPGRLGSFGWIVSGVCFGLATSSGALVFDPSNVGDAAFGLSAVAAGWLILALTLRMGIRSVLSRQTLIGLIVGFGLLARIVPFLCDPRTSDDIYRYVWEGRVQLAGFNPYVLAPDDPELASLRDEDIHPNINHPEISAIYPPVLQWLFRFGAWTGGGVTTFKLLSLAGDLATGVLLLWWLSERRHPLAWSLIWWWNPLVIVEFAYAGHADSIGVALTVLALYAFERSLSWTAISALTAGIATKLLPLLFLPIFWMRERGRVLAVAPGLAVLALPYWLGVPWTTEPGGLFHAFDQYTTHWRFNDLLFAVPFEAFEALSKLKDPGAHPGVHEVFAAAWARRFAAVSVLAVAVWVARRRHEITLAALWILGSFVLLTPTLHPWYLTWILPWLCFHPLRSGLALSGLIVLSYRALVLQETGAGWVEESWVRWAELISVAVLALLDWKLGPIGSPRSGPSGVRLEK
ncbi:MAG: hypothetical protein RL885_31520 [Planctomycetota bacterium]